ncbi:MAG: hypothetical protein QOD96_6936 [Pseudonocardiales bacterium]|jgi:hypothetical protein|nr:hypothetical protein [Pseudonocardiales bacterium]
MESYEGLLDVLARELHNVEQVFRGLSGADWQAAHPDNRLPLIG